MPPGRTRPGATVCCADKATGATKSHETTTTGAGAQKGGAKQEQEEVNSANEVDEKQFSESLTSLVKVAATGYPKALRSTYAKRNELLRKHKGDMEAAAAEVKGKGNSLSTEVKDMMLSLIPYVGLPVSVLKPMWRELRRGCLIAAVYGHDLSKEETQARVLMTLGVAQGGEKMKEKSLELAIKFFWSALCKKCGFGLARKLPVGKLVAVLDFEEKARQAMVVEFQKDQVQLDESAYVDELDPRPTNKEFLELLKDKGELSLHTVTDKATSLLSLTKTQDLLKQKGQSALHQVEDKAKDLMNAAKAKAGF